MARIKIEFDFADETLADEFVGWFLDGGGEYNFSESLEMHNDKRAFVDWNDDGPIRAFKIDWAKEE